MFWIFFRGGSAAVFGNAEYRISVKHIDLKTALVFFHRHTELVLPFFRIAWGAGSFYFSVFLFRAYKDLRCGKVKNKQQLVV